jgi:osmotically-inducible protein OsmY
MTVATRSRTDSQIHQDVIRELTWDTRVSETDVGVEVDHQVVTLTGTVPTYARKLAAQEAAHRVSGVLDVANDIEVVFPGQRITDTDIAHRVRHALEWELMTPADTITSTVRDGWVTLSGAVDSLAHSNDAARAVRRIKGVRGITNEVSVKPKVRNNASNVRQEIESALDRQAIRESSHLRIEIEDGRVRLDGTVRSWPERRAVVNAAKFTPGVKSVDETGLRVDPFGAV